MNEGDNKRLDLCFFKDPVPNTFKYFDGNFNIFYTGSIINDWFNSNTI